MTLSDLNLRNWLPHPLGWLVSLVIVCVAWCIVPARWFDQWMDELQK